MTFEKDFIALKVDIFEVYILHYILKRKSFATHIKRKFLPIDYKISFGDKWYGKSCSLSSIQHENQNAAAYGC